MRFMRLLCVCLLLCGASVCAAAPAAAPTTPTVPQPPLPGESPPAGVGPGNPAGVSTAPAPVAQPPAAVEGNPDWAETLERIAGSVVSIDVDSTRAFDTEWNSTAQATGFVVDAERGLILTNRHVVTPGPVTAEATFLNREEVQLYPVYRDPVHDFGVYRYDPQKLRFIKPKALPLYPEGAQIGREIRVVGNNAGEQLSILAGTLARLDRDAPAYGVAKYNDFNTFYLQAASGTSGGSSGSPVIDIRGRVVALNAGGASGAASSFYLPLGRVRRALELIQQGKPVARGTLYTVFNYMPYDELERLGLDAATEAAARKNFPRNTGMLVVTEVLPGSPSESVLQPGDILVRLNGRYVTQFEPLEDVLDGSVAKQVEVELERGGKAVSAKLPVGDLHAITPSAYAEFGDAVVNAMSYQQARHFNVPTRGVYVANPGYVFGAAGIPRGAVIVTINGSKTDTLRDFEAGIAQLADGERAPVRYLTIDDPNNSELRPIRMDRLWFPPPRAPLRSRRRLRPVGLQAARRRSATQARAGECHCISALPGPAAERARALGRHGDVRYAVLGVGDHRAQLSRHRPDRGCAARPGRGRSQHRAGRGRRCDGDLRRHRAGSGARGVHPSAAQLRGRRLRSGADQQHSGQIRQADAA